MITIKNNFRMDMHPRNFTWPFPARNVEEELAVGQVAEDRSRADGNMKETE